MSLSSPRPEPRGSVEWLNFAAAIVRSGEAHGEVAREGRAEGEARVVMGTASMQSGVTITVDGSVIGHTSSSPEVTQVSAYLMGLSVPELLAIWAWLIAELRDTLQDPKTSLYAVSISLPFLALVLHALKQNRRG